MDTFPKWLPNEVRLHAEELIKKGGLNTLKPLLMRLATYPEMEKVWRKLSSSIDDSQKLIDFLEYLRLHSALQGNQTGSIFVPSDNVQRKSFKAVSDLTKRMIHELRNISPTNKAHEGWTLLETALRRAELNSSIGASQDKNAKIALLEIKNIQSRLDEIGQHESIISTLELVRLAAKYASVAPDSTLLKRLNTARAKTNQLVLDLKQYLQYHFRTESPALIAAIVNTAFAFADGGVTEDDVRKLKSLT